MAAMKSSLYESTRSVIYRIDKPGPHSFVSKEFAVASEENEREIALHERLRGIAGVLQCKGSNYEGKLRLLSELCEKGSLRDCCEERRESFEEEILLGLMKSMARTLLLVHEEGIAHRAISAENWLLTDGMQPVLTDFGHAKDLNSSKIDPSSTLTSYKVSQHFFTEDILRLARVFYQIATCDFSTKVLTLPGTAVKRAITERGYSLRVSNTICYLLRLRAPWGQEDVDQVLRRLEDADQLEELPPVPESPAVLKCSFCPNGSPEIQIFNCEHKACLPCELRMREQGRLVCEICGSMLSSSSQHRRMAPASDYDSTDLFPARLL